MNRPMTDRARFQATTHYQPRDRAPLCDFSFWRETLPAWHEQGLPAHVDKANSDEFFGMHYGLDRVMAATGVEVGLTPPFEEIVLEDRGDRELVQQWDGVQVLRSKLGSTIPMPIGHQLVDRDS